LTFGSMSVLVIEDSENMCRILKRLLKSFGFKDIRYAANGQMALDMLHKDGVDLAILDWHMEPMDGIEFTHQIRKKATSPDAYLPIILLTAFTEMSKVKIARDIGVNEILTKPVSPEALYARLTSIVRQPRSYIETDTFFGPDRRRKANPKFQGPFRRRGDKQRTLAMSNG